MVQRGSFQIVYLLRNDGANRTHATGFHPRIQKAFLSDVDKGCKAPRK
jgi:hypothetical protein